MKQVLFECQDLFKKTEDSTIPSTCYGWHEIKTGETLLVKKHPYKVPCSLREEMKKQTGDMRTRGVLTEAATEWAAPVILVTKKSLHGTPKYLFCSDFRGLNAVIQVPVYSMPLVQENIDRLNGNKYFTIVDM
jgi:hypothetical protein